MQENKDKDLVYTEFGYGTLMKAAAADQASDSQPKENGNEQNSTVERPAAQDREEQLRKVQKEEVKTNKEEYPNIVQVKLHWGGSVYLEEKLLSKTIKIHIKTFYGARKKVTLDVDINLTIQQLKDLLLAKHLDQAKTLYNLRLVYAMGTIRNLDIPSQTIEQYRIPNNANMLLLVQTSFTWDPNNRAAGIKLSNNNLTAGKQVEVDFQTVLGTLQLSSGRHYWEVKIDNFNDEEDIFLGVAKKETNLSARPGDTNTFWGYVCLCGKKFGPDGIFQDYGFQAKKGDTIGVLLEYKSELASLSFYRNSTKCGVAFSNLTGSFYPAVCMNYGDIQVTLDPKAPMPIS